MDNLKGMGAMTLAMLTFAIADMFIVMAAPHVPIGQLVVIFGLFGVPILVAITRFRGIRLLSPALLTRPILLRNLTEIWATIGIIFALANLDFSLVSAVMQANPLLVTLGAAFFLGEPVGWRRWTAILVGLAGVLIILRPGTGAVEASAILAVIATLGLSARDLVTRIVPREIPSLFVATWGFASTIPAGLILMPFTGGWTVPPPQAIGFLAASSVFGAAAYLTITLAMRYGDIAVVTPFRYSRLIFAFAIALLVFGETPDAWTWIGAGIVVATGVYTLLREGRRRAA